MVGVKRSLLGLAVASQCGWPRRSRVSSVDRLSQGVLILRAFLSLLLGISSGVGRTPVDGHLGVPSPHRSHQKQFVLEGRPLRVNL